MTVKGVTKEIWLRKSPVSTPTIIRSSSPTASTTSPSTSDRTWTWVSRFKLDDFDVGFDPGTAAGVELPERGQA